jgi:hypothetical protein
MERRPRRRSSPAAWVLGAALAAAAAACGPTQSTALIMDADVQLQAATTADGEKLAPYEWTAAREYLHKAREEQGYADYELAIDYAEKAGKLARDAKARAMGAKAEGELPDAPSGATAPAPADPKAPK